MTRHQHDTRDFVKSPYPEWEAESNRYLYIHMNACGYMILRKKFHHSDGNDPYKTRVGWDGIDVRKEVYASLVQLEQRLADEFLKARKPFLQDHFLSLIRTVRRVRRMYT